MSRLPILENVAVIREMFPKCYYCAASIAQASLRDLVKVDGKNRLAHLTCPGESADAA